MRAKRLLILAGKLAVAGLLIGWLLRSGTLDFGALSLFFERPSLLIANLAVFAFSTVLGALRWRLLLRLADVHLPVGRAMQLAFTAVFFNVVVPGNIGGDVVKSIYVAREVAPEKRTSVFVIAFLDRLLALAGLVGVACVLTLARGGEVWADPRLRQLALAVLALTAGTFIAPIVLLVVIRRSGKRLEDWTSGPSKISKILAQLVKAARLVSSGPKTLLVALGLAVASHVSGIILFSTLATAITTHDVSVTSLASVYPIGMLTMVLPISYAGFGVGHVAFDQLFAMIGLTGGATVLNVYLIGQTIPCLLGAIPYLTLRREAPPTDADLAPTIPAD
ncbi:MAG: flippase-like domain-containing protein [Myxococcales bacterium]|nr:flippase-like domain-containing protein [Myxococcales bacterium]